jgi:hypothetical protein
MPAESCVARESRYGHMSESSLQKGSESRADRSAGRICGSGGRPLFALGPSSFMGVLEGVAIDAVERREAAMVRRICVSVERVASTTHAIV